MKNNLSRNANFNKKGWIQGLNTIRFILAIWVVFGHHDGISKSLSLILDRNYPINNYLIGLSGNLFVGVAAVILFFIISGIVIHFPYRNGKELDLTDFLVKRYIRIALPMLVIIAISLPFNFHNPVLWSLYCELIYYTIYPILLIQIRKYNINKILLLSYLCALTFMIFEGSAFNSLINQISIENGYNGNFMVHGVLITWIVGLPSWILGVKIAQNYESIISTNVSKLKIFVLRGGVLISSIVCSIARFHFSLSYTLSLNLFAIIGFIWLSNEISYLQKMKRLPLFESAGKWSYSIYLCHMFVLFVISNELNVLSPYINWLISIPSVLLISYLFYQLVEKPSHKLARSFNKNAFLSFKKLG